MELREEAVRALDSFRAAGIPELCLTWQTQWVRDTMSWIEPLPLADYQLDELLRADATADESSLIMRAPSPDTVVFDDCTEEARRRLEPYAFLIVQSSPTSYHVWLRLDRPEAASALRVALAPFGANAFSRNGGRITGFRNRKGNRKEPDGNYPRATLTGSNPGHIAQVEALVAGGVLDPRWADLALRPRRLPGPATPMAAFGICQLANWMTRRALLVCRWSSVNGREFDLPFDDIGYGVNRRTFRAQLDQLMHWRRITSATDGLLGSSRAPRTAILAFDRATRSFQSVVLPELEARGLPAALFVNVDQIPAGFDQPTASEWNETHEFSRLGLRELLALRDQGIELGVAIGNAHWKPTLSEVRGQLERGMRLFGPGPLAVAFWHGQFDSAALAVARSLGFRAAIRGGPSGLNPPGSDLFGLRAAHMADWHHRDTSSFAATAAGVRHLVWRFKRLPDLIN